MDHLADALRATGHRELYKYLIIRVAAFWTPRLAISDHDDFRVRQIIRHKLRDLLFSEIKPRIRQHTHQLERRRSTNKRHDLPRHPRSAQFTRGWARKQQRRRDNVRIEHHTARIARHVSFRRAQATASFTSCSVTPISRMRSRSASVRCSCSCTGVRIN